MSAYVQCADRHGPDEECNAACGTLEPTPVNEKPCNICYGTGVQYVSIGGDRFEEVPCPKGCQKPKH